MKIWISKNSEVPVREQLVTQITLGIAAGDFRIGEKLPSTREIARRCGLHSNTVGAAYQKLVDERLLEFRKGSGFYVAEAADERIEGGRRLDRLISEFLESASSLGFDADEVVAQIRKLRVPQTTNQIVVVESDAELRLILIHELSNHFAEISGVSFEEYSSGGVSRAVTLTAMLDEKPKIEPLLKDGQKCVFLRGRSVAASMEGQTKPTPNAILAVASGWDGFLSFARIMLLAANVDPGSLIVRSTADDGWRDAIMKAGIVICDSVTAGSLDGLNTVRPFQIISDESIADLANTVSRR